MLLLPIPEHARMGSGYRTRVAPSEYQLDHSDMSGPVRELVGCGRFELLTCIGRTFLDPLRHSLFLTRFI